MEQQDFPVYFPYSHIREYQSAMISDIISCLQQKKHLIAHAPTGLGKTAASLAPVIGFAMKNGFKVFFLTSRHTQHKVCIETLQAIRKKFDVPLLCCDLLGKQGMCLQAGVTGLPGSEFMEFCKKLRENRECNFFLNTREKNGLLTMKGESVIGEASAAGPLHCEEFVSLCSKEQVCPYYTAEAMAKKAQVICADYYYLFNPMLRNSFFPRIDASLEKSIIIIDEAHNLPKRCRELLSIELTSVMVDRCLKEAAKFSFESLNRKVRELAGIITGLAQSLEEGKQEMLVEKEEFIGKVNQLFPYDPFIKELEDAAGEIKKQQRISYLSGMGDFLESWKGPDDGFARILRYAEGSHGHQFMLAYHCLDPSHVAKQVVDSAYAVICMSGTMMPTAMYSDLLGFGSPMEKVYQSPFPRKNRLSLVIPETTTKYSRRTEAEFASIGKMAAGIANTIPGNVLVFFPSYEVRNHVAPYFSELCTKQLLVEKQGLDKESKEKLIEQFKQHHAKGAVMLCVAAGSFGEGIDLPGKFLRGVIVVGLPLEKPSLEMRQLIDYYDLKFGKGMEYGYFMPAMIKTIQNAGRCIRSAEDKGVVVFIDERYASAVYADCFPAEYEVEVTKDYESEIKEFFGKG
ncbi:ATP-dependent DNA helicase [Candidatus Woesearchaeota archaeon]|nr:ATP-dependent DNA helicase [Candidatus Woesearchaeota archaeon]